MGCPDTDRQAFFMPRVGKPEEPSYKDRRRMLPVN